jgi:hypothetical protein
MQVHLAMAVIVRMLPPPVIFKRGGGIKRLLYLCWSCWDTHTHTHTHIYFFIICICHTHTFAEEIFVFILFFVDFSDDNDRAAV